MSLLSIFDFTGRLHPVLVHLPIGILLLACFFQWLTIKEKFGALRPAIPVALFWGMLSAIAACISGFFLSQSGDYDAALVSRHQWLGIGVAVVALILYLLHKRSFGEKTTRVVSLGLIILVTITGHMGGSLTHGSGYLAEGLNKTDADKGPALKPIPHIQEAIVYKDMVQPLLEARCYSCHGPNKKKGKLRLDTKEFILKGGESGETVVAGKADESELISRMLLPMNHKDHMPPKEKPQLTPNEVALVHWWISSGADFDKKVKELPQTEKVKPVLLALQSGASAEEGKLSEIPQEEVKKADEEVIKKLKAAGVMVTPVAQNSNYLSANFVTAVPDDSLIQLLEPLKKQLIWLHFGNTTISDSAMTTVAKLINLRRLHLNNTAVTDKGLSLLKTLTHLRYINLVGTKITLNGLSHLKELKELNSIYLYQTGIQKNDWGQLQKIFPKALLDSGGYTVPTTVDDTTRIKY